MSFFTLSQFFLILMYVLLAAMLVFLSFQHSLREACYTSFAFKLNPFIPC